MRIVWCWRCKQDMPMLDEEEYQQVWAVLQECMERARKQAKGHLSGERLSIDQLFEPVRNAYEHLTGVKDCHHNAIMHHRLSSYGPLCSSCGKPLRTPRARFCAACGFVMTR